MADRAHFLRIYDALRERAASQAQYDALPSHAAQRERLGLSSMAKLTEGYRVKP